MFKILGISASLRNARLGYGGEKLISELKDLESQEDLKKFIKSQIKIKLENTLDLKNLGSPLYGLSNSEAAIAVALWGSLQEKVEIDYISLADYFPPNGRIRNLEKLKEKIIDCHGIVLSGPVYFGDRGSLAQSFIDFCSQDLEIKKNLKNKIYGGLSVGAKRNGGQETTLVYQMLDMANLNMLVVGNDSETSSQYGGTVVAGDIGTFIEDDYGFDTCLGTGKRVARTIKLINHDNQDLEIHLWLLQDHESRKGLEKFKSWIYEMKNLYPKIKFKIWDIASSEITRCLGCDICPTEKGPHDEYRCIIQSERDFFVMHHKDLIRADAIFLCAYSPEDRSKIVSQYQTFMERTRYLRRDNYLFTDTLVASFVISEISARQNLHLRMMTSAIRHHTIIHHPLIGMEYQGETLGWDRLIQLGCDFIEVAKKIPKKKLDVKYNPIGYIINNLRS